MQAKVMIVDDTPENIGVLLYGLSDEGYDIQVAEDGESALEALEHQQPDIILMDVMMPGMDGYETTQRILQQPAYRNIPILFMTALNETSDKVKGFESGGVDYITKPIQLEEVVARIKTHIELSQLRKRLQDSNTFLEAAVQERTQELKQALNEVEKLKNRLKDENTYLIEEIRSQHSYEEIIGSDPALLEILNKVGMVAATDSTVLIQGESGTGKELVARAIHARSAMYQRPMIKINCGAISPNLVESELFGHEKGSFTGAATQRKGRFELANGSTLFLDEVGELPLETQVKLLRVLQEQEFERVGGTAPIKVNVRIITATNRNLQQEVNAGRFREDLYYRLNVFPINVPPLRKRQSDIPHLAHYFMEICAQRFNKKLNGISEESIQSMLAYDWPGNIRELQNTVERAAIVAKGTILHIHPDRQKHRQAVTIASNGKSMTAPQSLDQLEDLEREIIRNALEKCYWQVAGKGGAAEFLDKPASTIRDRMKKLNLKRPIPNKD